PYTRHPVMTPDMIRQLPAGRALIIRGGMSPVIGRLPVAWKDPAYARARRHGHAAAVLAVPRPLPAGSEIPRPRSGSRPWATGQDSVPAPPDDPARYPWQQTKR